MESQWDSMRKEAESEVQKEPVLASRWYLGCKLV